MHVELVDLVEDCVDGAAHEQVLRLHRDHVALQHQQHSHVTSNTVTSPATQSQATATSPATQSRHQQHSHAHVIISTVSPLIANETHLDENLKRLDEALLGAVKLFDD